MTDLERYRPPTDTWVDVIAAIGDLAQKISPTEFVPKALRGKPAGTAAAILTGRELGLGPMASLRGLQVIEGSVSLTAQMTAARILAGGHRIEWVASTDKEAVVRIIRGDGLGEAEGRFTLGDAQRAGLAGKTNWAKYPRAMLRARALSEAAGMVCADVILGLDTDAPTDTPQALDRPSHTTTPVHVVQLPPEPQETPVDATEPEPAPAPSVGVETSPRVARDPQGEPLAPPMATRAQLNKINAQLGELERIQGQKLPRDERRDMIRILAGIDTLATANDLTKAQAHRAIEELDRVIGAAVTQAPEVVDAVIVEDPTDE